MLWAIMRGSFALAQLLHAAPLLDMSNEHGREALEGQLKRLPKSLATADDALAPAMRALSAACRAADGDGERAAFQRLVLELIGEVEDPLEAEVDEGIDAEEAAAAERREPRGRRAEPGATRRRAGACDGTAVAHRVRDVATRRVCE